MGNKNSQITFPIEGNNNLDKIRIKYKKIKSKEISKNNDKIISKQKNHIKQKTLKNYEEDINKTGDEKYIELIENNKKLKEELNIKENMINNIKKELNTKNEILEEINRMKGEMESYLQTMDILYGEIESRDGIIKQLKSDIQIIQNKYQNEI